jgi:hypothetical protein
VSLIGAFLAALGRHRGLGPLELRLARRGLGPGLGAGLGALQDGVGIQHLLDVFAQLDAVQLQQANGLLQLRRQRQLLGQSEL